MSSPTLKGRFLATYLPSITPLERPTRATRAVLTTSADEFAGALGSAIASSTSGGQPTSVLAVSIDNQAGESSSGGDNGNSAALREQVVELIRRNLRGNDIVGHPSSDDLMVLLPGTSRDEGSLVASRLCAAIRNHAFAGNSGDRPAHRRHRVGRARDVASARRRMWARLREPREGHARRSALRAATDRRSLASRPNEAADPLARDRALRRSHRGAVRVATLAGRGHRRLAARGCRRRRSGFRARRSPSPARARSPTSRGLAGGRAGPARRCPHTIWYLEPGALRACGACQTLRRRPGTS